MFKTKTFLALIFILLFLFFLPCFDTKTPAWATESRADPYTSEIRGQADRVDYAVLGVVDPEENQEAWQYKATCEETTMFIMKENLEAEQAYLKLDPDQKTVNENYRAYLKEAALVVSKCYTGETPDLTAMEESLDKLY